MVQHRCHDRKDPEQGTVPTCRASPTSHKDKQVLLKSPLLLSSICEEICTHIRGKGESLLSTLLYFRGEKKGIHSKPILVLVISLLPPHHTSTQFRTNLISSPPPPSKVILLLCINSTSICISFERVPTLHQAL